MLREGQTDLQKSTRPEVLNLPDALDACDQIYPGYSASGSRRYRQYIRKTTPLCAAGGIQAKRAAENPQRA